MKVKTKSRFLLVSVIIPTYNRGKSLCDTLRSLFKQDYPNFEIIVVDQSTKKFPEKEEFLRKNKAKIRYLRLGSPNASLARNIGVKNSRGEILLFLDDDVICDKKLIFAHVANYASSKVGAVGGRVLTPGQKIEGTKANVGQITFWGKFTDGFSSKVRQEVMTVITCNASWRKKVFEQLGGFDENFTGPIREDSDLSLRTIKAGYKIIFEPKAVVIHRRVISGGFRKSEGRLKWYFGFFKSETYFFFKYLKWYWWPIFWLMRWQFFVRCMFGFGREVSLRSMIIPWQGIYHGWQTYRRKKNDNRS